ncbi:MAG: hypothetical protein LBS82_00235 [Spirochaetaceae bacterium]|nr:hypothetical protein [Spirochaetaceae bacterium]
MNDYSYAKMFDFVAKALEQNPKDEQYQKILSLIIDKKSAYDLEMLNAQKEAHLNQQNNYFKFCMQDLAFRQQWAVASHGGKDRAFAEHAEPLYISP